MKMIKVEELHKEANGNSYTRNTYTVGRYEVCIDDAAYADVALAAPSPSPSRMRAAAISRRSTTTRTCSAKKPRTSPSRPLPMVR